jgi:hypothetical protein
LFKKNWSDSFIKFYKKKEKNPTDGWRQRTAAPLLKFVTGYFPPPFVHLLQSLQISLFLPNLASTAQLKSMITMEQDKRAVPDLSEKQEGEVPAGEMSGEEDPPHGDASPEQEEASATGSGAHANAAESDVEEVFEVIFID